MTECQDKSIEYPLSPEQLLQDYRIAYQSRQISLFVRREVMSGKAKFGIFGEGKELPQLAMSRAFRTGDFRSGYYRDQTFMLAAGLMRPEEFFAQLYGDTDLDFNPQMAGRVMNSTRRMAWPNVARNASNCWTADWRAMVGNTAVAVATPKMPRGNWTTRSA